MCVCLSPFRPRGLWAPTADVQMSMVVLGRGGRGDTEAEADTEASPGFAGEPAAILEASRQVGATMDAVSYTHLTLPTICSV